MSDRLLIIIKRVLIPWLKYLRTFKVKFKDSRSSVRHHRNKRITRKTKYKLKYLKSAARSFFKFIFQNFKSSNLKFFNELSIYNFVSVWNAAVVSAGEMSPTPPEPEALQSLLVRVQFCRVLVPAESRFLQSSVSCGMR